MMPSFRKREVIALLSATMISSAFLAFAVADSSV